MGQVRLASTFLGLCSLLLGSCTHDGAEKPQVMIPPGARYVAMGSSFAAGAGIGMLKPGNPERCGRTMNNYATLLAEQLKLTLYDSTCGGATTEHILGPWNELPAQIEAVTPDTQLVTVTVGGNDLGYVGNLFAASCRVRGEGFTINGREIPCFAARPPEEADYERTLENLRALGRAVKARSPNAKLVFVQYVTLVPDTSCEAASLSPEDARAARQVGERLARMTAQAAEETGALLLQADVLSRDHTPCDAIPWAVGFPPNYDMSEGAPWHPNAAGHAAIAQALAELLRR